MSRKAGTLLWNRKRFTVLGANDDVVPASNPVDIDTGITQVNRNFGGDPGLGAVITVPPGQTGPIGPASRVQVIPLAIAPGGLQAWTGVSHSEPYFDPATGTVHVVFTKLTEGDVVINALFWDPHSLVGPGQADTFNAPLPPPIQ